MTPIQRENYLILMGLQEGCLLPPALVEIHERVSVRLPKILTGGTVQRMDQVYILELFELRKELSKGGIEWQPIVPDHLFKSADQESSIVNWKEVPPETPVQILTDDGYEDGVFVQDTRQFGLLVIRIGGKDRKVKRTKVRIVNQPAAV